MHFLHLLCTLLLLAKWASVPSLSLLYHLPAPSLACPVPFALAVPAGSELFVLSKTNSPLRSSHPFDLLSQLDLGEPGWCKCSGDVRARGGLSRGEV